jgi:sugar phosphate isomerase/epimerase
LVNSTKRQRPAASKDRILDMRIGMKVEIGFTEQESWRILAGGRDVLALLRGLGVSAVETPVGADTDGSALAHHLRLCEAAGLVASLHPYSEGTRANPAYFEPDVANNCVALHTGFLAVAAEATSRQHVPAIVNVHAAAAPVGHPRRDLLEQSVRFFQWAREWCEKNAPDVRPVSELQIAPDAGEPIQRIADNYAELLKIAVRSEVGVCWDFGHAFLNSRRFGTELDPPAELLGRILHVHCHDVDVSDHRPLICGNVPWQRFLGRLIDAGFDGTVVLELLPDAFLAMGGLVALERSISALVSFRRQYLGNLAREGFSLR